MDKLRDKPRFGVLLREHRLRVGLTQAELAERAAISTRAIQDLERGVSQPHEDTALRLGTALVLSPAERASFTSARSPNPRHSSPFPRQRDEPGGPGVRGHNLPLQLTSFIGRDREISDVRRLLQHERLLTLTGAGGVGKTRLALQVAAGVLDWFADGVFLVQLAPIRDPKLVVSTIAQVLSVGETLGRSHEERLADFLRSRQLLLILDSFEHVAEASTHIVSLLASCAQLKILATTRAVLRISGEHDFPVAAFRLPPGGADADSLEHYDAIRLFVDRARGARPDFTINRENAELVASICRRVDGLPLGIELAAARVRHAPLRFLVDRLKNSLDTLTAGNRDVPDRQRTLRDTLAWSYELLEPAEQQFFRCMSVFIGGCAFDAAQVVCTQKDQNAFDLLGALVDKSLVVCEEQSADRKEWQPRYTMLETVREYASEQLAAELEMDEAQHRHAEVFLNLAEAAEPMLNGSEQTEWLNLLSLEHANLRAALGWADTTGQIELSLRLGASLARFWWRTGFLGEGQRWLERALARDTRESAQTRARALTAAGVLAWWRGEHLLATARFDESIELHRILDDTSGTAYALLYKGRVAFDDGDEPLAQALFFESLSLFQAADDDWGAAGALNNLGEIARLHRNHSDARDLYTASLDRVRKLGDAQNTAVALLNLGLVAKAEGEVDRAADFFGASLSSVRGRSGVLAADCLDGLAAVAGARGRARRSVCLFSAADALRQTIGAPRSAPEHDLYTSDVRRARSALGPAEFVEAVAEGAALSLELATAEALGEIELPADSARG